MTDRLAKTLWLLAVAGSVGAYGWYRLQPQEVAVVIEPAGSDDFRRANRGGYLLGSGSDTIVVFSSYRCSFCARLFAMIDSVMERDSTTLSVRFREVPRSAVDPAATTAAIAAECAGRQGRFAPISRWLFRTATDTVPMSYSSAAAASAVSDTTAFLNCTQARAVRAAVEHDLQETRELGFQSTPVTVTRSHILTGVPERDLRLLAFTSSGRR